MTLAQFITGFDPVIRTFGANKFPMTVLERMHLKIGDFTPSLLHELCNLIIDSCEHAPKTSKFLEFSNIVRARHREGVREADPEIQLYCYFCSDLGVIRAFSTDGTHDTLMRCLCSDDADKSNWKLPKLTKDWRPLYRPEPCPVSWFKPAILHTNPDGSIKLEETLNHKLEYWRAKVRIAEEFWMHLEKASVSP